MARVELIIPEGMEKLSEKLELIEKRAPGKIIERMDTLGRKVIKIGRDATPIGPKKKKNKDRLKYNYRADKTMKEFGVWTKKIRNKAFHYSFVKHGHPIVRGKKVVGFARGRDYFGDAIEKNKDVIDKEFEKMIDDLMGDVFK